MTGELFPVSMRAAAAVAATATATPAPAPRAFAAALDQARARADRLAVADAAETALGTRAPVAPDGGCRCGTFVATTAGTDGATGTPAPTGTTGTATTPGAISTVDPVDLLGSGTAVPARPATVEPGDIVISRDPEAPTRRHAGIVLRDGSYATVDPAGIVVRGPIPWPFVEGVRRR